MQINNQSKIISNVLGNDIDIKLKNDKKARKDIVLNIKHDKLSSAEKENLIKELELKLLESYTSDIEKYRQYDSKQIYNIRKGFESGLDVSFFVPTDSASFMVSKRKILLFNKNNPDNLFNLSYFTRFNPNKILLLFNIHKYNLEHPDNVLNLSVIEKIFNFDEVVKVFEDHKNKILKPKEEPKPVVEEVKVVEEKPKVIEKPKPKVIEKNIEDMSFGELADFWNEKHPNAQINASLVYAQKNKKLAEMVYVTSIYNLKFRNNQINIQNTFLSSTYDFEQREEILSGIKYNLKNTKQTIPFQKYMRTDIPAENMKIINKIMRLVAEYNVQTDIDYVIENYKDKNSLNTFYDKLFKQK